MREKFNIVEIRIAGTSLSLCSLKDFEKEFSEHFQVHASNAAKLENPPLYGILWPAAEGLACHLARRRDLSGKRILEIGCGLGLPSLICAKFGAVVTAMDKHWDAGFAVCENARLNGLNLHYREGSFEDPSLDLGGFDLIIGSDILYEPEFYPALETFILKHSKAGSEILIADPGRFAAEKFGQRLRAGSSYARLEEAIPGRKDPIVLQRFQRS